MDAQLLILVHELATASDRLARSLNFLAANHLTKGLPVVVLLWLLWFVRRDGAYVHRSKVLAGVVASIFAITIGRLMALSLPFRFRPLYADELGIDFSRYTHIDTYQDMSSMPSDHAVFFATLCMAVFLVHRPAGILIGLYCLIIVLMPRIAFGKHWPSDILVGLVVGIAIAWLIIPRLAAWIDRRDLLTRAGPYEHLLYPAMFLLTFQMATMFESARSLLSFGLQATRFVVAAAV